MALIFSLLIFLCFITPSEAKPLGWKYHPPSGRGECYSQKGISPFPKASGTFAVPETLRVLGICVQFQKDEDEETTGNGEFLTTLASEPTIDPPPHDLAYFEDQLLALSNYYRHVSKGKLILLSQVWPQIITLSNQMGYYNSAVSKEETEKGLVKFFLDAVREADRNGVDFSSCDTWIFFHAGVGNDLALDYDSTPKDLPSAFLNLLDLEKYAANEIMPGKGIPVQNGNFFVDHAIVLPETESQEGYELGLLGTAALMFGFRLGLPALWNTETGASGIGRWGLMDQGSSNFNGLIPAEPCAFEKYFLGWEFPREIWNGNALRVASSQVIAEVMSLSTERIYQIRINNHEYFLLENRMHDPNRDGITRGWDRQGREVRFLPNGQIESDGPFGVIVRVEEYDFGLPGSGILIWHVDENVIAEGLSQNRVNVNPRHRGVDLEEADGAQDIGESYGFLSGGAGSELGVMHDAWYKSNDIHQLANHTDAVQFGPETHPNTRSYSGANTHLIFYDFSDPDTIMTFSLKNEWLHFSTPLSEKASFFPPLFGDLNGDGATDICLASQSGVFYGLTENGNPLCPSQYEEIFPLFPIGLDSIPLTFVSSGFAETGNRLSAPPVVGDLNGDKAEDILLATENGEIGAFTITNQNHACRVDTLFRTSISPDQGVTLLFSEKGLVFVGTQKGFLRCITSTGESVAEIQLSDQAVTGIAQFSILSPDTLVASTQDGKIHLLLFGETPLLLWTQSIHHEIKISPCTGHFGLGKTRESLHVFQNGFVFFNAIGQMESVSPVIFPQTVSSPALGDLDGDGELDIVLAGEGKIWAFHRNGALLSHFPISLGDVSLLLSDPVLGDVNGDGLLDILVSTSAGTLEAFGGNGKSVSGFPLPYGESPFPVPPTLAEIDGDSRIELVSISQKELVVWDLPGPFTEESVPWGCVRKDPAGTNQSRFQPREISPSGKKSIRWAYNYPNPTYEDFTVIRYRLEMPAKVDIVIYDLAGETIAQFVGPGEALQENEVRWDLRKIESGVYFCEIRAKGQGKTETALIKIAVVK